MVDKDEHDHQINYLIEVTVYLRIENKKVLVCSTHLSFILILAKASYYYIIRN